MTLSPVTSIPLRITALLLSSWLAGCSTFSADGGFDAVAGAARTRLGLEVRWPRSADERAKRDARVAELLSHPLAPDDAVQIALLANHGLQAAFQQLGISEADLVQAGRLPNPRFTLRRSSGGGDADTEATLTFNVLSLVAAPYLQTLEKRRFDEVQSAVIEDIIQLAEVTRIAYFTALAARDSLQYAWQVKNAAQISAELAHRMLSAGNWNRLDQARQQGFYLEALQQLALAESADAAASAELRRLLGIAEQTTPLQLAEHLPDLPHNLFEPPDLEQSALRTRIDLQLMHVQLDELARRLKLTKATRFVDVLDAGPTRVRNGARQAPVETGFEVSLVVPLFDTGDARVRRSEARYAQAVERFTQAAIDARAEVFAAMAQYRAAFDMAVRERDDIMPARKSIADQDLLRYNASQVSVFELLADARDRIRSANDYIGRLRDFWIAKTHLDTVLMAGSAP